MILRLFFLALLFNVYTPLYAGDTFTDQVAALEKYVDKSPTDAELETELKGNFPAIYEDIVNDAKEDALKALWGQSLNYDENAKSEIVKPQLVDLILRLAKLPTRSKHTVHAGIEHTYAYLFSNLVTPFGYKRDRWVKGEIETGFDLPEGFLSPDPKDGTLFKNVTKVLKDIAILQKYKGQRVIEKVSLQVTLYTDLIPFIVQPKDTNANSYLLVYSIYDGKNQKLLTAFPVTKSFVDGELASTRMGDEMEIKARFNAAIDVPSGSKGSRTAVNLPNY